MSHQTDREQFFAAMALAGVPVNVTRKVLRHAATLGRLAVAQCNGDWPCDNGERKVEACPKCEGLYVRSVILKGGCPDCRAEALVIQALQPYQLEPEFHGDPRGAVVTLKQLGTRTDVYVPTPRY